MNEQQDHEGWDSAEQLQIVQIQQNNFIKHIDGYARNILDHNYHTLEADMMLGWKPKLPSCPLPLSYKNIYIDSLKAGLKRNQSYSIVYVGPRFGNSVKINQKYTYIWKYRQRYSLNLKQVRQAVQNVGSYQQQDLRISSCNYSFDSNFESGNLDLVVQVKKNQYDCFIRSDTNTKGHCNWYYFKVGNKNQVGQVKINICNMTKHKNLYSQGMRPYCKIDDGEWTQHLCYDVQFVERLCRYGYQIRNNHVQFIFNFTKPNQQVYFAYSIPYTYSDLRNFISQINEKYPHLIKVSQLCQSLGGVEVPLITVDDTSASLANDTHKANYRNRNKKIAVITSRIHPGESNSSYLMQGFIRELLTDGSTSQKLLKNVMFYIIPMLNPDGVIAGNFRTSYSGKDLNRQFNNVNKYAFPEIYALKQLCHKIKRANHQIQFYLDLHGHSSKKNLFCYGPEHSKKDIYYLKSKTFAKIMQKNQPIFSYQSSIFIISKQKKNTARAYMFRNLKIPMSFTFQITNGLYEDSSKKKTLFLTKNVIIDSGRSLIKSLFQYCQIQIKWPNKQITAKVDSGKYHNRKIKKQPISFMKISNSLFETLQCHKKVFTQKREPQTKQNEWNSNLQQIIQEIRLQDILERDQKFKQQEGSDSEGQQQDLSKQQSRNLFASIMNRQNITRYKDTQYSLQKQNMLMQVQQMKQNVEIKRAKPMLSRNYQSASKFKSKIGSRRSSVEREVMPVSPKHFTLFL